MTRPKRFLQLSVLIIASLVLTWADIPAMVYEAPKAAAEAKQRRVTHKRGHKAHVSPHQANQCVKEIRREKNLVVVSRRLADRVRNDNGIILSETAVRQRTDKNGGIAGYELVRIDRPGVLDKIGLREGDIIASVNDVPASDLTANRRILESASRFDLGLKRGDRSKHLVIEIR